ncbi:hypothetical protein IFM89_002214 [Coptis chinensis]|uniref:BAHD acyltransferase n=1 Tax=Coptis chinensis TaxID=261450 RepID=A0A835I9T7_9MAGN|nr:hypothetical protein IFM89_002214 [Coptis chinensis]
MTSDGRRVEYIRGGMVQAPSDTLFLNNWASIAKENNEILHHPKLDQTSLFPPKEVSSYIPATGSAIHKVVSKRFVFDSSNIAALRAKSSNKSCVEHPTRVEAVSALIWRCAMNVVRMRPVSANLISVAQLAVNLRGRMLPPLSNLFFGNLMISTVATSTTDSTPELHCLVGQLRDAIKKIDSDYVRKLQADDELSMFFNSLKDLNEQYAKGELEFYTFSSWCRFPFYEADFGWGKPIWISTNNTVSKNVIMFMDTKCGKGVEAWVALNEEDMARFECEPELIAFTKMA